MAYYTHKGADNRKWATMSSFRPHLKFLDFPLTGAKERIAHHETLHPADNPPRLWVNCDEVLRRSDATCPLSLFLTALMQCFSSSTKKSTTMNHNQHFIWSYLSWPKDPNKRCNTVKWKTKACYAPTSHHMESVWTACSSYRRRDAKKPEIKQRNKSLSDKIYILPANKWSRVVLSCSRWRNARWQSIGVHQIIKDELPPLNCEDTRATLRENYHAATCVSVSH